jgi:hypothetical protein
MRVCLRVLAMIIITVPADVLSFQFLAPMSRARACPRPALHLVHARRGAGVGGEDGDRGRGKVVVVDERHFPRRYKAALVQRAQSFVESFVGSGGAGPDASLLSASYEYVHGGDVPLLPEQFYGFSLDPFERSRPVLRFFGRTSNNVCLGCSLTFDADWRISNFEISQKVEISHKVGARQASASPQVSSAEMRQPEELLREEIAALKRQIAQQKQDSDDEIASLREQFQRLE